MSRELPQKSQSFPSELLDEIASVDTGIRVLEARLEELRVGFRELVEYARSRGYSVASEFPDEKMVLEQIKEILAVRTGGPFKQVKFPDDLLLRIARIILKRHNAHGYTVEPLNIRATKGMIILLGCLLKAGSEGISVQAIEASTGYAQATIRATISQLRETGYTIPGSRDKWVLNEN